MIERAAPLDWERAKQRLTRAAEALRDAERLSPERAKAVMDARARALAEAPAAGVDEQSVLDLLVFELAGHALAIESRHVREVAPLGRITPVPGAPEFVVGVMNLRGEVAAVMDLSGFLGLPRPERPPHAKALILGAERAEFGVVADAAHETARRSADEALAPSSFLGGAARDLLRGVASDGLLILDGERLLTDERFFIDRED